MCKIYTGKEGENMYQAYEEKKSQNREYANIFIPSKLKFPRNSDHGKY